MKKVMLMRAGAGQTNPKCYETGVLINAIAQVTGKTFREVSSTFINLSVDSDKRVEISDEAAQQLDAMLANWPACQKAGSSYQIVEE